MDKKEIVINEKEEEPDSLKVGKRRSKKAKKPTSRAKKTTVKERIKEKIDFLDVEGKFILVRVGLESSAAEEEEINKVKNDLNKLFEDAQVNCILYVTHHAIDISIIK